MGVRFKVVRESAAHGMQGVTVIRIGPVISTNEEQNEHEVTIQMVGNVFVLFCEIPSV